MQAKKNDKLDTMRLRKVYKVIGIVFYVAAIILVATFAIGYASGYRYNFNTKQLYKVSVIQLSADPLAELYINGSDSHVKSSKAVYLEPGKYSIELRKDGFHSYFSSVDLGSGQLFNESDIILFKSNIKPNLTTQAQSASGVVNDNLAASGAFIAYDHELWANGKFVTRLSDTIKSAIMYGSNYVIYQTSKGVFVVGVNGRNNVELFPYETSNILGFSLKNRNTVLDFSDGLNNYEVTITEHSGPLAPYIR